MEYVVAVDKYRHFVKAAESCNVLILSKNEDMY